MRQFYKGIAIISCIALTASLAHAGEEQTLFAFDIPELTVDSAINAVAQQSRSPAIFPFDQVQHLQANKLEGEYTLDDALSYILNGTGLQAHVTAQGVITVIIPAAVEPNREETLKITTPKKLLLSSAAAIVTSTAPTLAVAQENTNTPAVQDGFILDEVVTTARRRQETLLDAPIAITAVSGSLLEELGATDLTSIANIAPNVSFSTTGTVSGSTSSAVIYIRGIGQNDYVPVVDPGVGVYVDDVYYGRTVGAVLDLADINRVEVLRGPQGTLFGRNTIGGAISLITNDPSGESDGNLRLILGDQGRKEAFFTQNIEVSDTVSARLNVMRRLRDGTVERVLVPNSEKLGNENSSGARLKIDWEPTDQFKLSLAGDYVREREESAPEVQAAYLDGVTLPAAWNGTNGFAPFAVTSTASGCVTGDSSVGTDCFNDNFQLGPFSTAETSESRNDIDTWGLSATASYQLNDNWTGKLIVGHRDLEANFARQVDGTPLNVFENRDYFASNQTSIDARVNAEYDRLSFVGGAFYFTEESDNQLDFTGSLEGTLYPIHFGGITDNNNFAVYGEATFDLTDRFHLTGGLRFTDETKTATPNAFAYPGCDIELLPLTPLEACDAVNPPANIPLRTTSDFLVPNVKQEISFDKLTWRANAAFDLTDNINVYGTASTGFKSGGFEWRVTNTSFRSNAIAEAEATGLSNAEAIAFVEANGALPSFDPETVLTLELGLKMEFPDQGLRINTAVFDSQYEDQIVAANAGGIATFQTNAAESSIKGFEVETQWVPTPQLLLNGSLGYLDAKYETLSPGALAAGLTLEDQFILTPKWSASLGASYAIDTQSGTITPRVDLTYKSSQEFEAANTEFTRDDGFTAINAGIRYKPENRNWVAGLGVQNLTDELYKVGGDANGVIGYENVIFARPRNFFASFEYEW